MKTKKIFVGLAIVLLFLAMVPFANAKEGMVARSTQEPYSLESAHPYENDFDYTWHIQKTDATQIRVHFSKIEVEKDYDFLYVYDYSGSQLHKLTGTYSSGGWTAWSYGDTISVRLQTDYSVTEWGFAIDYIEYEGGSGGGSDEPVTYTFSDSLAEKEQSTQHAFDVPSDTALIEVSMSMPSGADYDLSVWDSNGARTGGWTSTESSTSDEIANAQYSGYSTSPETMTVEPPAVFGTWYVGCFAYSGSGSYSITVTVTPDEGSTTDPDTTPPTISITSPSDGASFTTGDVTIEWSGSDADSGIDYYEIQLNSGSWVNKGTSTSHSYTGLADGSHSVTVRAYDNAGNSATDSVSFTIDTSTADEPVTYTFSDSLAEKEQSTQHAFDVPSDTALIEVSMSMPSGADYDLSVWDSNGARTGGWTSTESSTSDEIANAQYSGYSTSPETMTVEPPAVFGTWYVGSFAYSGSGSYSITVTVTPDDGGGGSSGGDGITNYYAVIVGISDYKAISDLSYCDEDATDWYHHFTNNLGWSSSNVKVLGDGHTTNYPKYDAKATEYNMKYYLNWLVNTADEDDVITFTTSGHGSGDGYGSSFLCAWDSNSGESGEDGNLYDTELQAILEQSVAEKIFVFIDHCYSGGFGPELMGMSNSDKVYLTTTCSDNGYGYDYPSAENGAWTHYFLEYAWIDHYGGSSNVALEDVFSYALNAYPYSGGDTPEQYDGNTGSYFYLN